MFTRIPKWDFIKKIKWDTCNNGNIFKKLNLHNVGVDMNRLYHLRLSYNNLQIDLVDPKTNIPTRCRRYSNFNIDVSNPNKFIFTDNKITLFKQDVDDFRKETRTFLPLEYHIMDDDFKDLLTQMSALALYSTNFNKNIKKMNMAVHQVRLITYPNIVADNAPEGIHRDGADTIVSALVMNKHNIQNAESILYDENLHKLLNTKLNVGEFIFQEDRHLWHDITPIESSSTKKNIGYRDILGFDFIYN